MDTHFLFRFVGRALLIALIGGCSGMIASDYRAIVASPDRSEADRQTDERRNPELLLSFTGVRPGMRVLDMGAGGGYSTELLARAVGSGGTIYAQDAQDVSPRAKERFDERAKTPAMRNVVRVLREYDDPVPADARNLDLITFFFAYHDTAFMNVDRARMNRALFEALKPGGMLVVADHSAQAGAGIGVAKSLHRIEEATLRREIEAAGFRLVAEAEFLRHPEDPRDSIVFRPKVPVDEFVLRFVKPFEGARSGAPTGY
ncbi:MAG TPA: methyltransferase domain-containing protein [Xanthobacteraceae bacterium]|nr:methyltransferase domain-containing protein [Xanthobacteraceae bacterium]